MNKSTSGVRPRPDPLFNDPVEERILQRIPFEIIALSAILAIAAALIFDPITGLFILAGGTLAALSFLWLKRALWRVLQQGKAHAVRSGILLYAVRFLLILGVFLIIILAYPKKLLAFAAGFSTVVPVFLGEAAVALIRLKSWKDSNTA
jgi:uncharacterized membrane protein YdjX (TVP38/TMEM64 family)